MCFFAQPLLIFNKYAFCFSFRVNFSFMVFFSLT